MTDARPVDRVEVHVLVDNVTDSLSTVPCHVENEWSYLWRNGMRRLSGRCIYCAAHGLSCLITAHRDESRDTILFDTGPEEEVFEGNLSRLESTLALLKVSFSPTDTGTMQAECCGRSIYSVSAMVGGRSRSMHIRACMPPVP
jgi:hypothetical protein